MCNLASVALPSFIGVDGSFDFGELHRVVKVVVFNLNRVIDLGFFPANLMEAKISNRRHRAMGIGVQGLSDTFASLSLPFESQGARELNVAIFETIYHAALETSAELAALYGFHESWPGSPASRGVLQYDMWGVTPTKLWDWVTLKAKISQYGLRNSLLVAPMPTAGTSQILGFSECFDPNIRCAHYVFSNLLSSEIRPHSNLYTRRVQSGEFQIASPGLVSVLSGLGIWNDRVKTQLVANRGKNSFLRYSFCFSSSLRH